MTDSCLYNCYTTSHATLYSSLAIEYYACTDANCLKCPSEMASVCTECEYGYILGDGLCTLITDTVTLTYTNFFENMINEGDTLAISDLTVYEIGLDDFTARFYIDFRDQLAIDKQVHSCKLAFDYNTGLADSLSAPELSCDYMHNVVIAGVTDSYWDVSDLNAFPVEGNTFSYSPPWGYSEFVSLTAGTAYPSVIDLTEFCKAVQLAEYTGLVMRLENPTDIRCKLSMPADSYSVSINYITCAASDC